MEALLSSSQPNSPFLSFPCSSIRAPPFATLPRRRRSFKLNSYSASSPAKISSRRTKTVPDNPPSSSSLYLRPSLYQISQSRATSRTSVFEFLRCLGIVTDELEGLELPVTVEVMKERVDFLHSVGLTIEDINAYPLVLGCSVRKNMVPVLDYLGKIGVRKSTFTQFLRRYPQVLHASVVVDLMPVVRYLQGMDIKLVDIPRVLERYPEVLGYKLEGTMSTSVAFLVGIGVAPRQIGSVLTRYPEILGMRVGRIIKPFVEHLESIGLPRAAIARLIEQQPYILGFNLIDQVKPNLVALVEFGVRKEVLSSIIARYPDILGFELREKLVVQQSLLESRVLVGREEFGTVIERMPQAVSLSRDTVLKHVEFFKNCGFLLKQVSTMVVHCPQILALNLDIMKLSFDFFKNEMEREIEELVEFPAFFTYGLESTVRPRHKMVTKKGLKCSLAWLLNCSDDKFEERMRYDSIGIEEMDAGTESSFDMEKFAEPREEEQSGSEYDEDSDFEDSDGDYI